MHPLTDIESQTELPELAPETTLPLPRRSRPRFRIGPEVFLAVAVVSFAANTRLVVSDDTAELGAVFFVIGLCSGAWGAIRGFMMVIDRAFRGTLASSGALSEAASTLGNLVVTAVSMFWAWSATLWFSRGRQLRHLGRVLLPPVDGGEDWSRSNLAPDDAGSLRSALAAQWRENGRTEHASVAAFARLILDLMALGAPPSLVAAANRDALDEIRHTELCFSLARSLDGKAEGPGPFPEAQHAHTLPRARERALAKLAVDSLIDGALHEGVSARVIAQLAKRCEDPAIRAVLQELAADEGRHAAHGWDVVEWCLEQGGRPVVWALRGALRALPREMSTPLPPGAEDGSWERWGIHGRALEQESYRAALAQIGTRVEALVACRHVAA